MTTKCMLPTLIAAISCLAPAAYAQNGSPTTAPPASVVSAPPMDPEKTKLVRQLLDVMGTAKMMNGVVDQMIGSMKQSMTDVPPEFWTKFRAKVHASDIIDMLVPIYDKYYTKEDLQAVIAFYQSPAGQRMVASLPQVTADSMKVGQEWGRRLGEEAAKEVSAEKGK